MSKMSKDCTLKALWCSRFRFLVWEISRKWLKTEAKECSLHSELCCSVLKMVLCTLLCRLCVLDERIQLIKWRSGGGLLFLDPTFFSSSIADYTKQNIWVVTKNSKFAFYYIFTWSNQSKITHMNPKRHLYWLTWTELYLQLRSNNIAVA